MSPTTSMPIKFIQAYSIYQKNDIVAFNAEIATRLVASGVAKFVNPPLPTRPSTSAKTIKK